MSCSVVIMYSGVCLYQCRISTTAAADDDTAELSFCTARHVSYPAAAYYATTELSCTTIRLISYTAAAKSVSRSECTT